MMNAELPVAEVIGSGYEESQLTKHIALCLRVDQRHEKVLLYLYCRQRDEPERSIRDFCKQQLAHSSEYPTTPKQLASELLKIAEKGGAKYPEYRPPNTVKGWLIERSYEREGGSPILTASTIWLEATPN